MRPRWRCWRREHGEALEPALRAFELLLLREIGLLPALDMQTPTLAPLAAQMRYSLMPEAGLVAAREQRRPRQPRAARNGWRCSARWTSARRSRRPCGRSRQAMAELKPQLRALLHYHCGVATLRTRQLMLDLQAL